MRFSAPVFFDDGENMFLAERQELKDFHMQALIRWNVEYVYTYGHLLSDEETVDELEEIQELELLDDNVNDLEEPEEVEDLEELEAADDAKVDSFLEIIKLEQVVDDISDFIIEYPPAKAMTRKYAEAAAQMALFFGEYKNNEVIQRTVVDNVTRSIYSMISDEKNGTMSFILNKRKKENM